MNGCARGFKSCRPARHRGFISSYWPVQVPSTPLIASNLVFEYPTPEHTPGLEPQVTEIQVLAVSNVGPRNLVKLIGSFYSLSAKFHGTVAARKIVTVPGIGPVLLVEEDHIDAKVWNLLTVQNDLLIRLTRGASHKSFWGALISYRCELVNVATKSTSVGAILGLDSIPGCDMTGGL